jgi:uncharacterized phage protein (TIGR02218 family)
MRTLAPNILKLINQGTTFAFGFDMKLVNGKQIYLTSHSDILTIDDITYQPNSSLQITRANFNDSAHDYVEVNGIFEDATISLLDDLCNAEVTIQIILTKEKLKEQLLKLTCSKVHRHNLQFTLYLKNQITKLEQHVTKMYSKTCRARLGDDNCNINLESFASIININNIQGNIIIANFNQPSGYYDYGKVGFIGTDVSILILKQSATSLMLEHNVPEDLINTRQIKIFPGCDKTVETCYKKFNNVLNFRGEPFTPEFNYEKFL